MLILTIMTHRVMIPVDALRHIDKGMNLGDLGMNLCKKSLLFLVGIVTLTMDEVINAAEEASKAVDEQSEKVKQSIRTKKK